MEKQVPWCVFPLKLSSERKETSSCSQGGLYQSREQMASSLRSGNLTVLFPKARPGPEIQQALNQYWWLDA